MNIVGIIIIIVALIGGVVGGALLKPQSEEEKQQVINSQPISELDLHYLKLDKPLIIPIFMNGRAEAMLIAEIWLETIGPIMEGATRKKPRLRDMFLQIFSKYSAEGKLDKQIMTPRIQAEIRKDLTDAAKELMGNNLHAVLINDLQRQDM